MEWYLYILKCVDGSLYTGITTDLIRRVKEHNNKIGSKSLRGKLPVELVHSETFTDRSSASKRESEIKKLSRENKLQLVTGL